MSFRRFIRSREDSEPGSVSVLVIAVVVLVVVLTFGIGRLGHAASDRARADTAADAAALAAAGALAMNRGPSAAVTIARETATANAARLVRCTCAGRAAVVEVRLGATTGRARAEVRYECIAERC
jgi:secretion/DNA translocation related TadE-like protein